MNYSQNWNLEPFFSGGSHSKEFKELMEKMSDSISTYKEKIERYDASHIAKHPDHFIESITFKQNLGDDFIESFSFLNALQSQNTKDEHASLLQGKLQNLYSKFQTVDIQFCKFLSAIPLADWKNLLDLTPLHPLNFSLNELRKKGAKFLSNKEEHIINTLAVDGFYAWSKHYDLLSDAIHITYEETGTPISLSAGQAYNKMMSSSSAELRQKLFKEWEDAWGENDSIFADTLNHLDGFRIENDQLHGVTDCLEIPLQDNRMKEITLSTMWETISKNKQPILSYFDRKAKLFGKEKLSWEDQEAPIILNNLKERKFTFDEAAIFIQENFKKFSPKMSEFAKHAFEERWIEAEDRPHKRPGGYCEDFPKSKESRIFLTYSESINEVSTLAHELGHAFHSYVMRDLPSMQRQYAMNVAETASTFAELIVADATLKAAKTKEEKINLLDIKLQNAAAMLLNIHARFIFEESYYQKRAEAPLTANEISSLMMAAQQKAYQDSLENYHPHFWASKLHFFIDEISFYNFPYTFGYLFSLGIYTFAQQQETSFEEQYISLLRDTASMTTEELAKKHLNVNLEEETFWQSALSTIEKDVQKFLDLTNDFI